MWRRLREIAIFIAMKRVSVADAKNRLPALIHEADAAPIEVLRRGKPVAVILSREAYDRLIGKGAGVWAAIESYRAGHDLRELDAETAFATRDRSSRGRPVRW